MNAFKSQQHRWAKGGAQTCRKLLPMILKSRLPWRIKLEAFFHLTGSVCYLMMLLLTVLLFPALYYKTAIFGDSPWMRFTIDMSLVLLATFSASSFYVASQREIFRTWAESLKYLPFLMAVGVGISVNNARAALEGFFGGQSEFVRTPKFGVAAATDQQWKRKAGKNKLDAKRIQSWVELLMAFYMAGCVAYTIYMKMWIGLFFMCLFTVGYFYVAILTLASQYLANRATAPMIESESSVDESSSSIAEPVAVNAR
ncbi:MAG: hypothetical protein IPK83_02120 [Planctomycetes bacterium]|nr:hypothetical protein [Planctomycetota bacterium]